MRVTVNLASRPFVELRPLFLRLRLLMAGLLASALLLALGAHLISAKAEVQQVDLDRLRNLTINTQTAKLQTEQRLRQPANAEVIDRAHFLNTLFLRKSFSWTAAMMDLEDVLPPGVQVTSIEPAVTADGSVLIRLRVAGERANAVQLVRNLERSHRFLEPRLGSESAQTKENGTGGVIRPAVSATALPSAPPGVEFEILARYNPLPANQPYPSGHSHPALRAAAPEPVAAPVAVAPLPAPVVAAAPSRMEPPAAPVSRPAPAPGFPNVNPRNGYPRDGVVLPPYGGPPRPQDGHLPLLPNRNGAGGPQ